MPTLISKNNNRYATSANSIAQNSDEAFGGKLYTQQRWEALNALESQNAKSAYPHYVPSTSLVSSTSPSSSSSTSPSHFSIAEFIAQFKDIAAGEKLEQTDIEVTGRIMSKRKASSKLVFLDVISGGRQLQVMASLSTYASDFSSISTLLKRGDIIAARGYAYKTKTGELSLVPRSVQLITPCVRDLPETLRNPEVRQRKRYLDLIVNPHVRDTFILRAKIISFIRNYLNEREFVEVETPILSTSVGGANALPFTTHAQAIDSHLFMRIAPELYLKQLVIGGLERVYELGKCFRNEGVDATHNPEFTTVELYAAYHNYNTLIHMTEHLYSELVKQLKGSTVLEGVKVLRKGVRALPADTEGEASSENLKNEETVTIDFAPPFKRVDFIDEIQRCLEAPLPDLNAPDAAEKLLALCKAKGVPVSAPYTVNRLLDTLGGYFIEPHLIQPTFLLHHPLALSPLAKGHPTDPNKTERFELFIGGKEICNAYTELNDPREQRERFRAQAQAKAQGDDEAQPPDEAFCEALEYALPPTGGWGMGIDRFVMLLTGATHIRDVQLFPTMKDKIDKP